MLPRLAPRPYSITRSDRSGRLAARECSFLLCSSTFKEERKLIQIFAYHCPILSYLVSYGPTVVVVQQDISFYPVARRHSLRRACRGRRGRLKGVRGEIITETRFFNPETQNHTPADISVIVFPALVNYFCRRPGRDYIVSTTPRSILMPRSEYREDVRLHRVYGGLYDSDDARLAPRNCRLLRRDSISSPAVSFMVSGHFLRHDPKKRFQLFLRLSLIFSS